jgi:hypothetical protein
MVCLALLFNLQSHYSLKLRILPLVVAGALFGPLVILRGKKRFRRLGWGLSILSIVGVAYSSSQFHDFRVPQLGAVVTVGAGLLVLLGCILLFPAIVVKRDADPTGAPMSQAEFLKAKNDVRTTLVQGLAGALLLFGALATWRQVQTTSQQLQISERQQTTERFVRAVDQLGSKNPDVRLGGIIGLGQIADTSQVASDGLSIIQLLTGYLRHYATWHGKEESHYIASSDWLAVTKPDIQEAIEILARQNPTIPNRLLLNRLDLRRVDLQNRNLVAAFLAESHLEGAFLSGTDFREANLNYAYLTKAELCGADFTDAELNGTDLTGAEVNAETKWPTGYDWKSKGTISVGDCDD